MREPKPRVRLRQPSLQAADMAARTHIRAQLGWLRGIPRGPATSAGMPWLTIPRLSSADPSQELTVDRERLRATEFGRNAARRRFPKALPRVVGDVEAWTARTNAQFDVLKQIIHAGATFPGLADMVRLAALRRSTAQSVLARGKAEPRLVELLAALVWIHWLDEEELLRSLAALPTQAVLAALTYVGCESALATALHTVQLAADDVAPHIFRLIGDQRVWDVPIPTSAIARAIHEYRLPESLGRTLNTRYVTGQRDWPPPSLGEALVKFAMSAAACDATMRSQRLALLEPLIADTFFAEAEAWWRAASHHERRAEFVHGRCRRDLRANELKTLQALEDEHALRAMPPSLDWLGLRADLEAAATAPPAVFSDLDFCVRAIAVDADGQRMAARFIEFWSAAICTRPAGFVARLLAALRRLLVAKVDRSTGDREWFVTGLSRYLADEWLYGTESHAHLAKTVDVLALMLRDRQHAAHYIKCLDGHAAWSTLFEAAKVVDEPALIARAFVAAPPSYDTVCGELWVTLLRFSAGDSEIFSTLVKGIPEDAWYDRPMLAELQRFFSDARTGRAILEAVRHGHAPRLVWLGRLSHLARSFGTSITFDAYGPRTVAPGAPADGADAFAHYPEALHPILFELMAVDPRATSAIEDILGADLPSPRKMAAELEALGALISKAEGGKRVSLEKRRGKLEMQLAALATGRANAVKAGRLANLQEKLAQRVSHARLTVWETALVSAVKTGIEQRLGVPVSLDWIERSDITELLSGVSHQSKTYQSLAYRLLASTLDPEAPRVRDDPRNQAFLDRLTVRGINITPWLDGVMPEPCAPDLTIALDRDIIEVLRMGAHFETCLAPNGSNFFSAIANAADINKGVLFARSRDGTVQARCLLALDDNGRIISFHIYAHKHSAAVVEAVRIYTEHLAEAMGTTIAPSGVISRLVAPDWYDDGPRDLTGQFAMLEDGAPFRVALETMAPSAMVDHVKRSLPPAAEITSILVLRIAVLSEVERRPALILPLLAQIGDVSELDRWTLATFVRLVRKAGERDLALRMLDQLARAVERSAYQYGGAVDVAEEYLALGLPHRALSTLRRTRDAEVRDWLDEAPDRLLAGAQAMAALSRPHRALDLARLAAKLGASTAPQLVSDLEAKLANRVA